MTNTDRALADNRSKSGGNNQKYYIGLMSGTSADGIDLALVDFNQLSTENIESVSSVPKLIASFYQAYSPQTRQKITSLYTPSSNEIDQAFALDVELAHLFSDAIDKLLQQEKLNASDIIAIGNHGQTIRHRPNLPNPFTLQIGCCQTLATLTNIRVIGQFRRKDMALGGQGAPLVPAFHQAIFKQAKQDVFVINIGGIANITYLPCSSQKSILGFDTGPGNALMDDWFQTNFPNHTNNYDNNGDWAATGTSNKYLLAQLMADNYFKLPPPKSTGREYFSVEWLTKHLSNFQQKKTLNNLQSDQQSNHPLTVNDIQATLINLTASSISNSIKQHAQQAKIYLCGGGVHNKELKNQLIQQLTNYDVILTDQNGINTDIVEAMAFAWLAFAYDKMLLSSIPAVTGASKSSTLGTSFYP
ncbi:MAG: anhydro-N-acetylmuramic acid kinase [Alteromonadaceae bacterium]|nr:anhydro-N-acetylmuramic acid kinase [Alteromonadaceae bacterium]